MVCVAVHLCPCVSQVKGHIGNTHMDRRRQTYKDIGNDSLASSPSVPLPASLWGFTELRRITVNLSFSLDQFTVHCGHCVMVLYPHICNSYTSVGFTHKHRQVVSCEILIPGNSTPHVWISWQSTGKDLSQNLIVVSATQYKHKIGGKNTLSLPHHSNFLQNIKLESTFKVVSDIYNCYHSSLPNIKQWKVKEPGKLRYIVCLQG